MRNFSVRFAAQTWVFSYYLPYIIMYRQAKWLQSQPFLYVIWVKDLCFSRWSSNEKDKTALWKRMQPCTTAGKSLA